MHFFLTELSAVFLGLTAVVILVSAKPVAGPYECVATCTTTFGTCEQSNPLNATCVEAYDACVLGCEPLTTPNNRRCPLTSPGWADRVNHAPATPRTTKTNDDTVAVDVWGFGAVLNLDAALEVGE
ncbi:hypothetical protein GALMADRAFT_145765 [Galerina marginata CBS 339.88]|uniref:Kazal-like domain-containing protein n=1 Tax=Galerina marginata (strain CBS 339.88) TaxID=685588 RepID=A0A067SMX0_GALM3|nr:hypothetical protein GALMADRAFT_145765 [Galerina marginata CBS 339.88]